MTEALREKIFRVVDGQQETLPIVWHIYNLRYREAVFDYLIKHKITGKKILDIYQQQNGSPLNFCAEIIRRANGARKKDKLYAKKDYIC